MIFENDFAMLYLAVLVFGAVLAIAGGQLAAHALWAGVCSIRRAASRLHGAPGPWRRRAERRRPAR
jgi:hypothetical protein